MRYFADYPSDEYLVAQVFEHLPIRLLSILGEYLFVKELSNVPETLLAADGLAKQLNNDSVGDVYLLGIAFESAQQIDAEGYEFWIVLYSRN